MDLEAQIVRHTREIEALRAELKETRTLAAEAQRTASKAGKQTRTKKERTASPTRTTAAPSSPARKEASKPSRPRKDADGKGDAKQIDLNEADFEDLRELGLSIADSARLLASRELRQGFSSVDDLDELDGFPPEVVSRLKRRARV